MTEALARRGVVAVALAQVRMVGYVHPFRSERVETFAPVGQSVSSYLASAGIFHGSVSVWLNDELLLPEHWSRVRPKANCTLTYRVWPRGSGLLRSILFISIAAASIAASVFTAGAAAPLFAAGSAWPGLLGAGAGFGVSHGGSVRTFPGIAVRKALPLRDGGTQT